MSSVVSDQVLASRAILKLLQNFDPDIKSWSDLKNGAILLKVLSELKPFGIKSSHANKNPFQILKKNLKKSPDKDILQHVNLDQCERGSEHELLCLSAILLHRLHLQKKENAGSFPFPNVGLSPQEVAALRLLWKKLDIQSSCSTTGNKPEKHEVLKEFNYSPRQGSPPKQRSLEMSGNWTKEIRRKELCISNLRTQLDDDQGTISSLLDMKKSQEDNIMKLEKTIKDQRVRLSQYEENQKNYLESEDLQTKIKSLTVENQKLNLKVRQLKDSNKEVPFLESESKELRSENGLLLEKISKLEQRYQSLEKTLQDSTQQEWQSNCLSQELAILKEEMQVKEETIAELNHMVLIYQDRLDRERTDHSAAVLDSSDSEVISMVCSPFRNTTNELTALQQEINSLLDEKTILESCCKESSASLIKSAEDKGKLEKEVNALQNLVDHLNGQLQENKNQIDKLESSLEGKEGIIDDLTKETDNLKVNREWLNDVILNLERSIEERRTEKRELLKKVSQLEEMGCTLSDRVEFGRCNIESLSVQLEDLVGKIGELSASNSEQAFKVSSLTNKNKVLESEISVLQAKHQKIIDSYETVSTEKVSVCQNLEQLQQDFLLLQCSKSDLQDQLKDSLTDNEELVKSLANSEQECVNVLEELKNMCEEKQRMASNLERLKFENCAFENQKSSNNEKIVALETEGAQLSEKYSILVEENRCCQERVRSKLQENEELINNLQIYEAELYSYKSKQSEFENIILEMTIHKQSLSDQVDKNIAQHESDCSQIKFLNERYDSDQSLLVDLRQNFEKIEYENTCLGTCILTLQTQIEELVNLNQSLKLETAVLGEKEIDLENNISSLIISNSSKAERLTELDEQMKHFHMLFSTYEAREDSSIPLVQKVCSILDKFDKLISEKKVLEHKIEQLHLENGKLKDNFEELKERLYKASSNMVEENTTTNVDIQTSFESPLNTPCCNCDTLEGNLKVFIQENEVQVVGHKNVIQSLQNQLSEMIKSRDDLLKIQNESENRIVALETDNQSMIQQNKISEISCENKIANILKEKELVLLDLANNSSTFESEIQKLKVEMDMYIFNESEFVRQVEVIKSQLTELEEEKIVIIAALCEKEENLEILKFSTDEQKATIDELTRLAENRAAMVDTLNQEISSIATTLISKEHYSSTLEATIQELSSKNDVLLIKEGERIKEIEQLKAELLNVNYEVAIIHKDIQEKEKLLQKMTEERQTLIATEQALREKVSTLTLKEQYAIALEAEIQELSSKNEVLSIKESERIQEIEKLKTELSKLSSEVTVIRKDIHDKEKLLQQITEECQSLVATEQALRETLNEKCLKIQSLDTQLDLQIENQELLQALAEQDITEKKYDSQNIQSGLNDIHNPALKQWMDQFNCLCEKIHEMRQKHTDEIITRSPNETFEAKVCFFENGVLTMIRNHIHSWFTSSEFLSEEEKAENENKIKIETEDLKEKSLPIKEENLPCKACLGATERINLLENALEYKIQGIKAIKEKHGNMFKKLEAAEKELCLTKDTMAICKEKYWDLKKHEGVINVKHEQELSACKEQISSLRGQVDTLQTKLSETEKKYLEEMQVVFKKFQEKMNNHNTTCKMLSQAKVQKLELTTKYNELLEKYNWRKDQIQNLTSACKQHLSENENLKTELRKLALQKKTHEMNQSTIHSMRKLSMLPDASFLQESVCSGDLSGDISVFAKPSIPRRFVCDEEEGHFLDHSRNISDLQEGRCEVDKGQNHKDRLKELQRRNTLYKPHLRTSYPVETQTMFDTSIVKVEEITSTPLKHNKAPQPTGSVSSVESFAAPPSYTQHRKRKELWRTPFESPAKQNKPQDSGDLSSSKKKQSWRKKAFSPFRSSMRKDKH